MTTKSDDLSGVQDIEVQPVDWTSLVQKFDYLESAIHSHEVRGRLSMCLLLEAMTAWTRVRHTGDQTQPDIENTDMTD